MNKQWRWLAVGALALGFMSLGAFLTYRGFDHCPVRFENFNKIEIGMTQAEVEQLLGCESGYYAKKRPGKIGFAGIVPGWERAAWQGDDATISITFRDGRASELFMTVHPQWIEFAGFKLQWRSGSEILRVK
jgi:hypothetical protein